MRQRLFSLLEMMMVLVLASFLLVMAMPAFHSIISGNSVKASASHIGSLLQLGRQYAVARRRPVAVLMPGNESGSGLKDEHKFRVARLAFVEETTSGDFDFVEWVENSSWLYLPVGALVMEVDEDVGVQDSVDYARTPEENGATLVDACDLSEVLGGASSVDGIRAVVYSTSGRIEGDATHLTIGESAFTGGYWVIKREANTATNRSSSNQINLELNRFTGGVRYIYPESY